MAKNLEQIMADVRRMQENTEAGQSAEEARNRPRLPDDQIRAYVQKELKGEAVEQDGAVSKYLADLLARNPKLRKGEDGLAKYLPKANEARKEKMKQLRNDATRSGIKKVLNDLTGGKRREAKKELRSIAQDKLRSEGKTPIADEKTATRDIAAGRSRRKWRLLQPAMNFCGLGSHKQRHNENKKFPTATSFLTEDTNIKTPNGNLNGMLYKPNAIEDTGKVVIFFSGSYGPAAEYCTPAVTKYLNAGASVLTVDYRGFGKSETLNKKGRKTGTPLCEKTLYEDGKEMLKYVTDTMGVKPENIILHGFSLGGAVASKVAADFYQEQQKKALEEGRLMKEQKLGGLVLHSSIDSMYDSAKTKMWGIHLAGMLGWSGAGAYNTKSHMQRLHKFDPDLPVHYVSGNQQAGDHLDLTYTKISQDPKAQFWNSCTYRNLGGHLADNLADDPYPEEIVERGRDAQLGEPQRQQQMQGPGLD